MLSTENAVENKVQVPLARCPLSCCADFYLVPATGPWTIARRRWAGAPPILYSREIIDTTDE